MSGVSIEFCRLGLGGGGRGVKTPVCRFVLLILRANWRLQTRCSQGVHLPVVGLILRGAWRIRRTFQTSSHCSIGIAAWASMRRLIRRRPIGWRGDRWRLAAISAGRGGRALRMPLWQRKRFKRGLLHRWPDLLRRDPTQRDRDRRRRLRQVKLKPRRGGRRARRRRSKPWKSACTLSTAAHSKRQPASCASIAGRRRRG